MHHHMDGQPIINLGIILLGPTAFSGVILSESSADNALARAKLRNTSGDETRTALGRWSTPCLPACLTNVVS